MGRSVDVQGPQVLQQSCLHGESGVSLTDRLDSYLKEWAEEELRSLTKSCYSGIDIVTQILMGQTSTSGNRHKILWWPKNRRIAIMSRAMHQVDKISQLCLMIHYGRPLSLDGKILTKYDLARNSSVTVRKFNTLCKKAKNKLSAITRIYG